MSPYQLSTSHYNRATVLKQKRQIATLLTSLRLQAQDAHHQLSSPITMLPIFQPLTLPVFCAKLPHIGSILCWTKKRATASTKKQKSIARQHSGRRLARDPSLQNVRVPPRFPRKRRATPLSRGSSNLVRSAKARIKRTQTSRKLPRKQPPATYRRPDAEARHHFRLETPQERIDTAYRDAHLKLPRPRTIVDTVFVEELRKLNVRNSFLTENFHNRVRLDEATNTVGETLLKQAEHDTKARELRERLREQSTPSPTRKKVSPSRAKPKAAPVVDEALRRNWAAQEQMLKDDADWKNYQARVAAGEIPPNSRPLAWKWSLWDKVRAGEARILGEIEEARRMREEAARKKEAEAEAARVRKLSKEQRERERIRAEWEERMRREALAEELKAAEEENAARQRQAKVEAERERQDRMKKNEQKFRQTARTAPEPTPYVPPQTDDPELFAWEIYTRKWAAIKRESNEPVPVPLDLENIPWPQFNAFSSLDSLSEDNIRYFVLNYRRPGFEAKLPRERLRQELLLYHPDKFNARVLPYLSKEQHSTATAAASRVTMLLQSLLSTVARGGG